MSKISRRGVLKLGLYGAASAFAYTAFPSQGVALTRVRGLVAGSGSTSVALAPIFDANGELRTIYPEPLIRKMISSGLRALSNTVVDPKIPEAEAFDALLGRIQEFDRFIHHHSDVLRRATSVSDIDAENAQSPKLAVFYNLQNSTPVEGDLSRVRLLRLLGIVDMQLTYNLRNRSGCGCYVKVDTGITDFGRKLVAEMEKQHMLLDLSHVGMRTMNDAIGASTKPMIISHSGCRALWDVPRNTTDKNLRALADKGGVIGIYQLRPFLTDSITHAFDAYLDHIDHAVKVAGIDHVGMGTDRDYRAVPTTEAYRKKTMKEEGSWIKPRDWPLFIRQLNGPGRASVVREALSRRGYTSSQVDKIMGGNVYRVYKETVG